MKLNLGERSEAQELRPSNVVFSESVDSVNPYTEEFLEQLALAQLSQLKILKQAGIWQLNISFTYRI